MKKLLYLRSRLVIFLIFGTSICAFGQNNNEFLLDSIACFVSTSGTPDGATDLGKAKYYYDTKNNLIAITEWNGKAPVYHIYTYSNHKLTSIVTSVEDTVVSKWTISYNADGLTTDSVYQTSFNNSPIRNDTKFSYEYNTIGKKAVFTKFLWSDNVWTPNTRNSYTYDSEGRLTDDFCELSNGTELVPRIKTNYTYDVSGRLIEYQLMLSNNGTWENYELNKYSYNGKLLIAHEYFNNQSSTTTLKCADSLFYQDDKLILERMYQVSNGSYVLESYIQRYYDNNRLFVKNVSYENTLEGPMVFTTFYYYKKPYVGVEDITFSQASISPNPAYDQITISAKPSEGFEPSEASNILIYNSLGAKVMSVPARHTAPLQVNISDLPKGMYFVKIGTETAKFMKM